MLKIYDLEAKAGLTEKLSSDNSASCIAMATVKTGEAPVSKDKLAKAEKLMSEMERKWHQEEMPSDVMLLHAIMVSTNWNKNDDVFTPDQVWPAQSTPRMKPVNKNHMGREGMPNTIMGVIINAYACDDNYEYLSKYMDENGEEISYHILVGCMIWEKYFPEAAKEVKQLIDKNKQFVSMECFFGDFGYALRKSSNDDEILLMPRNDLTAWMTESLRIYGGSGKVTIDNSEYQIGRWLKSIIFSGMGLVENPANPESIVFTDYISHANSLKLKAGTFNEIAKSSVLNLKTRVNSLWLK